MRYSILRSKPPLQTAIELLPPAAGRKDVARCTDIEDSSSTTSPPWRRIGRFTGLILTTAASTALLGLHLVQWRPHDSLPWKIFQHQATAQLVIQVTAGVLGMIQTSIICELINVVVRRRLRMRAFALNTLHFWISVVQDRMDWNVAPKLLGPLIAFVVLTAVPSALWAGALAPVSTESLVQGNVSIPAYVNIPSLNDLTQDVFGINKVVRTKTGVFSYSVGLKLYALLVAAAAAATPPDGSVPIRAKPDETQYVYNGRSYGIGSAVGLISDSSRPGNVSFYTFKETGYDPQVKCIYNYSAVYSIEAEEKYSPVTFYDATGYLPNSNILDGQEMDPFVGFSSDNIVAFGTTHTMPVNPQRFIAVAAGKNYDYLNKVQCSIDFVPTAFEVSVSVRSRIITVQQLVNETVPPQDINPSGDLSFIAMRQLTAISHESMSWDLSIIGDAFNSSIENYKSAQNISMSKYGTGNFSKAPDNLPGITNSMTAMIDDVLIGFASAQVVVSLDTQLAPAQFYVPAVEFGEEKYIYAVFVINIVVVLFVIIQAGVTHLWRHLPGFDCLDPRSIIIAASKGGGDIAQAIIAAEAGELFVILQELGEELDPLTRWPSKFLAITKRYTQNGPGWLRLSHQESE